ncbi:metal ABC transporter ATP-binding protein [Calidifontibacter sp. DB0510]|uniref:Metal ABC transporter ATP-binding protein n=1 Tax=Metallococcus carri TaxID=1656884 RepID=A0A967EBK9_9MICO|nr:metal ABC transporter ATP-binding protein [Metallococcus carri]NHN57420.1 metal ABC transporter ATP-binding protein [Metallococcus carri]NOP39184.1 metal ABC transporter ATP-binding protein [Calidifontibacter sp. DB2511S]
MNAPVVQLRDASFGYAGAAVVSGVSFAVRPGEVVAVLGPNGSGKSTVMKGILGLNDQLSGVLELFGEPAGQLRSRSRIGYVPQRHTLSTSVRATVREIVEVGRLPLRPWWRRATDADRAAVDAALAEVGLFDLAGSDVSTLSGGQQRRVLIARALAGEPEILVMDEPTAGVDTASQQVLAEVLRRLAASGVTMIIVTHELEALRGVVSRIVEISHGQLTFDGVPAEWARFQARRIAAVSANGHHHPSDHEPHGARAPYGLGPLDSRANPVGGQHD